MDKLVARKLNLVGFAYVTREQLDSLNQYTVVSTKLYYLGNNSYLITAYSRIQLPYFSPDRAEYSMNPI